MAATGIVSLEFIINLRRGLQLFLQTVRTYQRRRTVHLIKLLDFLRNVDIRIRIVQFLPHQFLTEHAAEFFKRHRL